MFLELTDQQAIKIGLQFPELATEVARRLSKYGLGDEVVHADTIRRSDGAVHVDHVSEITDIRLSPHGYVELTSVDADDEEYTYAENDDVELAGRTYGSRGGSYRGE